MYIRSSITVISFGRDEGRDFAANTCFLWKITRYLLHVRSTKLHLSTRQWCTKYLPDYQCHIDLKVLLLVTRSLWRSSWAAFPHCCITSSPCLAAICPSVTQPLLNLLQEWEKNLISVDIQNIQEPGLPTVCPNSFVTNWMRKILVGKCCGLPWGTVFPLGSCGSSHRECSSCQKNP